MSDYFQKANVMSNEVRHDKLVKNALQLLRLLEPSFMPSLLDKPQRLGLVLDEAHYASTAAAGSSRYWAKKSRQTRW